MRMVIKFVLYALVVLLLVSWLTTVVRSCGNETDSSTNTENPLDAAMDESMTEEDALVSDLLESADAETREEKDPSTDNSPQITSIDYSKKLDKDEEAMLQEMSKEKEEVKAPAKQQTTTPAPSTKPAAPSGSGNYFVITGSFGEKANANKQQEKLKSLGYSGAEVVQFDGAKLYSVISGRYSTSDAANKAANELKSRHRIDCYVKKKEL